MQLKILFHDCCFDGLSSAALFTAFYRTRDPDCEVLYGGLQHGPQGGLSEARLDADANAVLDFAYLPSERLDWWIDHHRSAFATKEDEAQMRGNRTDQMVYDPTAPSCTGLLARFLQETHGFDCGAYADLIRWAELIDSASFETPSAAVELKEPAFELMLWVERSTHFEQRCQVIEALAAQGVQAARELPVVASALPDLRATHRDEVNFVEQRCVREGEVVYCDLTDAELRGVNKFVPYHLFPDAPYAVMFSRGPKNLKLSVGYNAWHAPELRQHDIAALCKAHGGGGHPYVGAITRSLDAEQALRAIGRALVATLNR